MGQFFVLRLPNMENESQTVSSKSHLFLPISILVAGILVSGALVYNAGVKSLNTGQDSNSGNTGSLEALKPVTDKDHIRGDINAPVKIVTFEDTECPFCKRFHVTMQQLMKDYNGKVAWVYRHFPLDSIHSKARREAFGAECVASLGGNDNFWAYLDNIFEITPSNDGLDPEQVPKIAAKVGIDQDDFQACLASKKFDKLIEDNLQDAIASGGSGTPYSVVIDKNGKKYAINGALPLEQVKLVIEQALRG